MFLTGNSHPIVTRGSRVSRAPPHHTLPTFKNLNATLFSGSVYWFGLWMSVMRKDGFSQDFDDDSIWKNDRFYFSVFIIIALVVIVTTVIRKSSYTEDIQNF